MLSVARAGICSFTAHAGFCPFAPFRSWAFPGWACASCLGCAPGWCGWVLWAGRGPFAGGVARPRGASRRRL